MTIFFIKSLLSIFLLIVALFSMFTMLEVYGRSKFNAERLKKIHKLNGKIYFVLYLVIAYFCLDFIVKTKTEPSARAVSHIVFSVAVILLLCMKILFLRIYRQFYNQVKILGLLISLLTFGMIAMSSGYYLLITELGTEKIEKKELSIGKKNIQIRTDAVSIARGKKLYESKCYFCHDAYSTQWGVGPGHKGILKNPILPVSKRPATPENIISQIKNPYKDMPSFDYLSEADILDLIAYLNTL